MEKRIRDTTANSDVSGAADTGPLSAREVAAALGVSERTVRRAILRGELPATKHRGVYRITTQDLAHCDARHLRRVSATPRTPGTPLRLIPFPERDAVSPSVLPQPLTSLIGREPEIATAVDLLRHGNRPENARLLTMTGPGGVGKTRLAIRVAEATVSDFPDGVWFASLASIADPELVTPPIAHVLGVYEAGNERLVSRIAAFLADKRSLLIVDNFEHVIEAAPLVVDLLQACPALTILVTSRTCLRVSGEHELTVPLWQCPKWRWLLQRTPVRRQLSNSSLRERRRLGTTSP